MFSGIFRCNWCNSRICLLDFWLHRAVLFRCIAMKIEHALRSLLMCGGEPHLLLRRDLKPTWDQWPMPWRLRRGQDLFICSHNQSRTHVEHADARLQKIGLCYVIEWTWLWFWLAWLADYRGSERFDIFHAWWSWEMKLWYGVTGYLMTFQPKRQIPNTGSSQSIVRLVFLFFAKSFWQSVHCT